VFPGLCCPWHDIAAGRIEKMATESTEAHGNKVMATSLISGGRQAYKMDLPGQPQQGALFQQQPLLSHMNVAEWMYRLPYQVIQPAPIFIDMKNRNRKAVIPAYAGIQ
jgi:hypothetical protein